MRLALVLLLLARGCGRALHAGSRRPSASTAFGPLSIATRRAEHAHATISRTVPTNNSSASGSSSSEIEGGAAGKIDHFKVVEVTGVCVASARLRASGCVQNLVPDTDEVC